MERAVVRLAVDLMDFPSQVKLLRAAPLPAGTLTLLRIAANEEDVVSGAAAFVGRSRKDVREAAGFFIEQVLFYPGASSYRVLGAKRDASSGELRRNMALLLRWLHPDLDPQGERSIFAARVTRAWNDLKTPERRAAYDRLIASRANKPVHNKSPNPRSHLRKPTGRHPFGTQRLGVAPRELAYQHAHASGVRGGILRKLVLLLLGRPER